MRSLVAAEDEREIITPQAGLARRGEHAAAQLALGEAPERALLCWGRAAFDLAVRYTRAEDSGKRLAEAPLFLGKWGGVVVAVVAPGIGAPATALVAEKLIAAGSRVLVGVGFAGSIHPLLPSGTLVVADGAERDEGTSRHYLAEGTTAEGWENVKEALEVACGDENATMRCGRVWTTDAVYRETVAKAREMRKRGAMVVEMETAGLLAVARYRGARAGALLVVADELARIKPMDVPLAPGEDPVEYVWKPAAPGSLDRPLGAAVRAALAAVTGALAATPESEGAAAASER